MDKVVDIKEIVFDDDNFNKGTARGRGLIEHSIQTYGLGRSVLLDKNNRLIAGNKAAAIAGEAGITKVRIIETRGDEIIAVKRIDLDLKEDTAAQELAIADNKTAEENLSWNFQSLKKKKEKLNLPKFFSVNELAKIELDEEPDADEPERIQIIISVASNKIESIQSLLDKLKKIKGVKISKKNK